MGTQGLMSSLQSSDCLLTGNRREGIQEFVEAVATFQVVDKIPKRHASSDKDRSPPQNIGITVDHCVVSHCLPLIIIAALKRVTCAGSEVDKAQFRTSIALGR